MLITGVSGLLGNNLAVYFRNTHEILGLFRSNKVKISGVPTESVDLADHDQLKRVILGFNPDILLHCASFTDVEKCENERQQAYEINVKGSKKIVDIIRDRDICLVYISSDSVYDGVKGNFNESDRVNPQNYYGLTKYQGESEILKHKNCIIFRTNIFGWNIQNKNSLGEWILNQLLEKNEINGFQDAYFSSIYTLDFARVIDISITKEIKGIYNCGSRDYCSKYDFSQKIADQFDIAETKIIPISIDEFHFNAKRGKNLTLDVNKLEKAIEYRLPTIDQSIRSFYEDYKCGILQKIKPKLTDIKSQRAIIPYGRQWIDSSDIDSVIETLRSDRITQGPVVEAFEKALAKYCNADSAVAVNSGTSGLHIACLVAGVAPGDEIITSPITFVASANCAVYCGAKPVFADIDEHTYNIDPSEIERKITKNTKAIIPVHFAGQSCDMERISKIVKKAEERFGHKIFIIEDGSHALGSSYKKSKVGSCTYSDMSVMSFHPVKHITTAEGGAVLTNNANLTKSLKRFRSHGITSNPEEFMNHNLAFSSQHLPNPWYYEQIDLGFNYRITDLQCALGRSQLRKIEKFRQRRKEIVKIYNQFFKTLENLQTPYEDNNCDSNFHLYILLINFSKIGIERANFIDQLKAHGIQTQVHYIPVHAQPFFKNNFGTKWGDYPNAEQYYQQCLSIPLFPAMSDGDVKRVMAEIAKLTKNN